MNTLLAFLLYPLDSATALLVVLFLMLVFSGVGLPLPEEVTLVLGGYLAYLEFIGFWPAIYVLIIGIVVADTAGFLLGRFAGEWVEERIKRFASVVALLKRAERYFERYGEKMVFFSRPLLGVRVLVPILAGHFGMNFIKFLLLDAVAAIPWTFLLVFFSYHLGSGLDLITEVRFIKHIIYIAIGVVIIVYALLQSRSEEDGDEKAIDTRE